MKNLLALLMLLCITVSSFAQDKIYKGSKVNIIEIAKGDTYYEERVEFLGKEATALGDLTKNSTGFYSGTLEVENGRTCFFKNIRVSKIDEPVKTFVSKDVFTGTIPKGTAFKILEVSSDDSYYSGRKDIEGKTGVTTDELTADTDGYTTGSIKTSDGSSYYFYKVKLGKNTGSSTISSSSSSKTTTSATSKPIKYVTGTLAKGTVLYVAEISSDDSYYSDRFDKIGARGKVDKSSMTMKEDGYYAGDFLYDDGSTAYFYKAKFSKEPVAKLVKTSADETPSGTTKTPDTDYSGWEYLFGGSGDDWYDAQIDKDIKKGDKVEITAVSEEDSHYEDRADFEGKTGVAQDDIEYVDSDGGYSGTIKLDNSEKPFFYLVKLKKSGKSNTSSSSSSLPSAIAKNTKVVVTDLGKDDSFYESRSKYTGKTGKVAEGLTLQNGGYYSGKILFDDKTDAYFFNVKITILK